MCVRALTWRTKRRTEASFLLRSSSAGASAAGMRPAARSGSHSAPPTSPARISARLLRFDESCCWRFVRKRELCCVSGRSLWNVSLEFCIERLTDSVDKTLFSVNRCCSASPRTLDYCSKSQTVVVSSSSSDRRRGSEEFDPRQKNKVPGRTP
ncbi:unnamed protein product [Pleuronectes platessa]|uniref:Uncharacterized protein n=1 Tax=Pleuronectes platessa TaxID=8262 RepID=A0A9N7TKX7_PLEPL|nr:unnamed protein product [Pleuronectes platessa]